MIKLFFFSIGMICILSAINMLFRKKNKAFFPFALIQFFIGYGMCITILIDPEMGVQFQHFTRTTAPFQFLYGPLFYFFWVYMFRPQRKMNWLDLLHLIPFILSFINYTPFYALSAEEKWILIKNKNIDTHTLVQIPGEFLIKMLLFYVYAVAALIPYGSSLLTTLRRASRRNKFIASWMILDISLKLLSLLAIFFNESFFIGSRYFNPNYLLYSLDSMMNVFVIHLYPFVLRGFRGSIPKPIAYTRQESLAFPIPEEDAFSEKEKERLHQLKDLLEVGQLFTDEELTTRQLASKLSCTESNLEQLVFKKFKMNTETLIDVYRINFLIDAEEHDENFRQQSKETKSARAGFKTQIAMEAAMRKFMPLKN